MRVGKKEEIKKGYSTIYMKKEKQFTAKETRNKAKIRFVDVALGSQNKRKAF